VKDSLHLLKATKNYSMFTFLGLCINIYISFQFPIKLKMVFVKSTCIMLITHAQQARHYINWKLNVNQLTGKRFWNF